MTVRARFLDISKWQVWAKFDEAVDVFSINAIAIRLSNGLTADASFPAFYDQAMQENLPVVVYHVFQPYYSPAAQFSVLKAALGSRQVSAIVIDLEIHGGYSKAYLQLKVKELLDLISGFYEGVGQIIGVDFKSRYWIYSRRYFLQDYFGFPTWLCNYFSWVAQYPYTHVLYPADFVLFDPPKAPIGWCNATWGAWQFTENMSVEGCFGSRRVDANVANMTEEEFIIMLGISTPPPDPTEYERPIALYVVAAADYVNVRALPTTAAPIVGRRLHDEKIYVFEERLVPGLGPTPDLWGRISPDSWAAIHWHNGTYFVDLCIRI